jgi:mitotic spindle assembly checkpoint protein MAD1
MEQENEGLANQVELLEENQGIRGAYNPETHQVLEFRDSPDRVEHAIRTATLERLRSENDALLLGDLEKGLLANDGQSLVPRESLEAAQAESAKLREQVQQKEKMMKRITQVSASQGHERRRPS